MSKSGKAKFQLVRRHMPELDCLRGVAILSVLFYHGFCWINPGPYDRKWEDHLVRMTIFGWLGVNLFFILSGFLITGILLDTKSNPAYYKNFYIKRALRILPALAATLILAAWLRMTSFSGVVVSIFFLVNYAAALGVSGAYGPLWSLAVEEHFYLVWPTLIHRFKSSTVVAIAFALCLLEPILRYFSGSLRLGDPHTQTHLIADYLSTGALLAIFGRSRFATKGSSILLAVSLIGIGAMLLYVGIPYGILHRGNRVGDALQVIPFNLIFAGALVLALAVNWNFFSGPWTSPLRYLGYVSYGLYLYHLLVFSAVTRILIYYGIFEGGTFHAVVERFVLMFVASLLVSHLSRRWMEQWFLEKKRSLAA